MNTEAKTTSAKINAIAGKTYFRIKEEANHFSLWTRENGDTCEGRAAPYDIAQGRELATKLRAAGIACRLEVVDEWVDVIIPKA